MRANAITIKCFLGGRFFTIRSESGLRVRAIALAIAKLQADTTPLKRADQFDNVGERPADPIELPDHQRVALAQGVQRAGWPGVGR